MIYNFQTDWWQFVLLAIGSYLIGSINFSVVISKLKGKDIRKLGSGNPGTLNMSRNFGLGIGILTLLLDVTKGLVPTLTGYLIYQKASFADTGLPVFMFTQLLCGFFAVVGHIFPLYYKFKGGKGIAVTIGAFLIISPRVTLISAFCAIAFIFFTEIGSMGSFIATVPPAIATLIWVYTNYVHNEALTSSQILIIIISNVLVLGIILLTWFAHRVNITRLITSEENPTNWGQMVRDEIILKRVKRKKKTDETNKE